jgi:signal peptidase I
MSLVRESARQRKGSFRRSRRLVVGGILLALLIRTFIFQPFGVYTDSMKDTLLVGDYLLISKYTYGYSRFLLPGDLDLWSGRIWSTTPKRGDVVVFKLPIDESASYIKRVIGLPGDTVQVSDGILYINGQAVPRERNGSYVVFNADGSEINIARYRETLPDGVSYNTLDIVPNAALDNTPMYEVPEGNIFVMGDNRDISIDSRTMKGVGYVPIENLVGRAEIVLFSLQEDADIWEVWKWPWTVRWSELLKHP